MFFKNLSIRKKIATACVAVVITNVLFGYFLHYSLEVIETKLHTYTDETQVSLQKVDEIREAMSQYRRHQFAVFALKKDNGFFTFVPKMKKNLMDIEQKLTDYEVRVWDGPEKDIYYNVVSLWKKYFVTSQKFTQALENNDHNLAYRYLYGSLKNFTEIESQINIFAKILEKANKANKLTIVNTIDNTSFIAVVINIVMFFFMVICTLFFTRSICGPLNLVVAQANRIAQGNLSEVVQRNKIGNDELGELADSMTYMQNNLQHLVKDIFSVVEQLIQAVKKLSNISNQSLVGMEQQQYQIEQVTTAMTEMKAVVSDVARNTDDSATQTELVNSQSDEGVKNVKEMVDSIKFVAGLIDGTGETVDTLEQQSQQITMVVDVIRGIAEQTNLLALNAAIEAARAGESGRGFAVVADEVRTLAGRTQDSTGQIASIIKELQESAIQTKKATDNCRTSINHCVEQGQYAQDSIFSIQSGIAQVTEMGIQITQACSQQNAVANNLNCNIENIHEVSQQSAQGAKHTTQACEELSQLALSLQQSMARFRLV